MQQLLQPLLHQTHILGGHVLAMAAVVVICSAAMYAITAACTGVVLHTPEALDCHLVCSFCRCWLPDVTFKVKCLNVSMYLCCCLQDEQRELANTIRVSGSILLWTVSNFLDFFKMETGKQLDIVRAEIDLKVRHLLTQGLYPAGGSRCKQATSSG